MPTNPPVRTSAPRGCARCVALAAALGLSVHSRRVSHTIYHDSPGRIRKFRLLRDAGIVVMSAKSQDRWPLFEWRKLRYLRLGQAVSLAESVLQK